MLTVALVLGLFGSEIATVSEASAAATDSSVTIQPDEIVQQDFLGVGVNLIPVSLMPNNLSKGYDEAYWEMDRKRILTLRPKVARVWFQPDWMESVKGTYTWDSDKMSAFYKYLDVLKEAGTEVELNFGWKVGRDIQSWFGIPGVDAGTSAPQDVEAFATSASELLNELIANRHYSNIKYLTFYNEPNGSWDFEAPGDQKAYYANIVNKVHEKLLADGRRDLVEIWGPEEWNAAGWTQYMKDHADAALDAYTFHIYGGNYDDLSEQIALRKEVAAPKPTIMSEFGFSGYYDSGWDAGYANYVIKAANEGLRSALAWQLNGVWIEDPNEEVDTNDTYTLWDSLIVSKKPNLRYYEYGLLTRYIPAHSTVVKTSVDSLGLRAAAFKTDSGDYTIVLETKEGSDPRSVSFDFSGVNIGKTFHKYVYNDSVVPEPNALLPAKSGDFTASDSFTDGSISANRNVIIYSTMEPAGQVEMTPSQADAEAGQTLQLSANLIDASGGVTWSVVGDVYGTITQDGRFTAPSLDAEKRIAVKAASANDPDVYGIALIHVAPAADAGRADIPLFSLEAGTYTGEQTIEMTTATVGASVYYSTDGSIPAMTSMRYDGPITLSATKVLKAIAFKDGLEASPIKSALYRIHPASSGPEGYEQCALESQICAFPGTADVMFGVTGKLFSGVFEKRVPCTQTSFGGDPAPGNAGKACYYKLDTEERAAAPTFYPPAGSYDTPQTITLATATAGAEIRYTTNGAMPDASSQLYTGPFSLSSQQTVKAVAIKSGLGPSAIGLATFKIVDSTGGPEGYRYCANEFGTCTFEGTFSVADGANGSFLYGTFENSAVCALSSFGGSDPAYNTPKKCYYKRIDGPVVAKPAFDLADGIYGSAKQVAISSATQDARIYYTLDGSKPSEDSARYAGPIEISRTTTLKAIAFKEGMNTSVVSTVNYTIKPGSGNYVYCSDDFSQCAIAGSAYAAYGASGSFNYEAFSGSFMCIADNFGGSDPAYNIPKKCYVLPVEGDIVSKPDFDPPSGSFSDARQVVISSQTQDAEIFYTMDGSEPTVQSIKYTGPIEIAETTSLRAIAIKAGMNDSIISQASYSIAGSKAAMPSFSPGGGSYGSAQSVSIISETPGAEIRYTVDGSEPSSSSALYTSPVNIAATATLKAIAIHADMSPSDTASATYTIAGSQGSDGGPEGYTRCAGEFQSCDFTGTASVMFGANDSFFSGTFNNGVLCIAGSFGGGDPAPNVAKSCYYKPLTGETAEKPSFSLADGLYGEAQVVSILTATPGASIFYTTDGSTPTSASMKYTGPIEVADTVHLKAIAMKDGMNGSALAEASYAILPGAGDYAYCANEFGTCAFEGDAIVAYGAGGSFVFEVFSNTAVCSPGSFGDIDPAYNMPKKCYYQTLSGPIAGKPSFNPGAGTYLSETSSIAVTIASDTDGALIRYTTDGSTPTASSAPYTGPVTVTGSMILKAIAFKEGFHSSIEARADYRIIGTSAYLNGLTVGGEPVAGFDKNTSDYTVTLPAGTTIAPEVAATSEDGKASVQIAQALSPTGTAAIEVTAEDGETKRTYTVAFTVDTSSTSNPESPQEPIEEPTPEPDAKSTGLTIDEAAWSKALEDAAPGSAGRIVRFQIDEQPGADTYTLDLPASAFAARSGLEGIEVKTPVGTVVLPKDMFGNTVPSVEKLGIRIGSVARSELSDDVRLAVGDRPVIELNVMADGSVIDWNNRNVRVMASIPYELAPGEDPERITVWYIDGQGKAVPVTSGKYDPASGTVTFKTSHFSQYAVVYVDKTFTDLADFSWAAQAIGMLASKGVVQGTAPGIFSPNTGITRADYVHLLVRTLDLDGAPGERFTDVPEDANGAEAIGIARGLGIVKGRDGDRFDPDATITRAEMAALTERALAAAGIALPSDPEQTSTFADRELVPAYAKSAVDRLAKSGLLRGDGERFYPLAGSTRAQAAVLLYKIYKLH